MRSEAAEAVGCEVRIVHSTLFYSSLFFSSRASIVLNGAEAHCRSRRRRLAHPHPSVETRDVLSSVSVSCHSRM